MRRLILTSAAKRDLAEIVRYIGRASSDAAVARGFGRQLQERCRQVAALPGTLGVARPDLGETIRTIAHGNYLIVFRYLPGVVQVTRIVEGHRDPGRWSAADEV